MPRATLRVAHDIEAPPAYVPVTDRINRTEPAVDTGGVNDLTIGGRGAGYKFVDPEFGATILRVTDEDTDPLSGEWGFVSLGSGMQRIWNADGSRFVVIVHGGSTSYFWALDREAMTIARIGDPAAEQGGAVIGGYVTWHPYDPDICYGVTGTVIREYDFSTVDENSSSVPFVTVVDLDDIYNAVFAASMPNGASYEITASGNQSGDVILTTAFGGSGSVDNFRYAVAYNVTTGRYDLLDCSFGQAAGFNFRVYDSDSAIWTDTSRESNGSEGGIHNVRPTQSPNWMFVSLIEGSKFLWSISDQEVYTPTFSPASADHVDGHDVFSDTHWFSHAAGGFNGNGGEYAQWAIRPFNDIHNERQILATELHEAGSDPQYAEKWSNDDHCTWHNQRPGEWHRVILGVSRQFAVSGTHPFRCFDQEIIGVTSGPAASDDVERYCHHQSDWVSPGSNFYAYPLAQVDPLGRYVLFGSNWQNTLNGGRVDVFMVDTGADD